MHLRAEHFVIIDDPGSGEVRLQWRGKGDDTSMTVYIGGNKCQRRILQSKFAGQEEKKQIVTAWHKSKVRHCFKTREHFDKAVKDNI